MVNSWHLGPDGHYRRLSATEDVIADTECTCEDARDLVTEYTEIRAEANEIFTKARHLVAQSRRDRRLRTSALRLVRKI